MVGSGWVDLIVVGCLHMECNHLHIQLMPHLFFTCVCAFPVHVCMFLHVWVHTIGGVCTCMWGPESDIRCFVGLMSFSFTKAGSLTDPITYRFSLSR